MSSEVERQVMQGVVEKELDYYGDFGVDIPQPIEITPNTKCSIAIREVNCLIPQVYQRGELLTLYAKQASRYGTYHILKRYYCSTVINNVQDFIDFIRQESLNFIAYHARDKELFGLTETRCVDINNYFSCHVHGDKFYVVNKTTNRSYLFKFSRYTQLTCGLYGERFFVGPASVHYQNLYLNTDTYNFNEFLVIELDCIEKTTTKNGSEPILASFYQQNGGDGNIIYKPNTRLDYKEIVQLGTLRRFNFKVRSSLDKKIHIPRSVYAVCTQDPTKNCIIKIKYEIMLENNGQNN